MTVTDPAADNLISRPAVGRDRLAEIKPGAYDIQRVTIATTDTMLCASVTVAQRDRVRKPGQFIRRLISLEFAPARPRPRDTAGGLLARLIYGHGQKLTEYVNHGGIEQDESDLDGERVTGAQGREVQLAVPVRELYDIASRPGVRSPVINLDPRSFTWRISVASDCFPGPRQLTTFPSGRRVSVPNRYFPLTCR